MIEKTIGEERLRISFHPSSGSRVDQIREKAAELINLVEYLKPYDPRAVALAQTAFEEGAMWAEKAATAEKKD